MESNSKPNLNKINNNNQLWEQKRRRWIDDYGDMRKKELKENAKIKQFDIKIVLFNSILWIKLNIMFCSSKPYTHTQKKKKKKKKKKKIQK